MGVATLALRGLLSQSQGTAETAETVRQRYGGAIGLLTIVGVVYRAEIALLLGTHISYLFIRRSNFLSVREIVVFGLLGLVYGLISTVLVDSYFWRQFPLWPELSGFSYNILHGQASNWGTSPFFYYFTSALPRLLFNPLTYQVFGPFALAIPHLRSQVLDLLLPNLAFVFLYSFQPHKEWRFIIYVIPPFLAISAAGASWIWTRRHKTRTYQFFALCMVASSLASFGASYAMLAISRLNYPGAEALNQFHAISQELETGVVRVHMDTLTCMTGVTRFLQIPPPMPSSSTLSNEEAIRPTYIYDKTDDPTKLLHPSFWEPFDYALAERPEAVIGKWEILHTVNGFSGVKILRPGEEVVLHRENDLESNLNAEKPNKVWARKTTGWVPSVETWMRRYVTRGWWVGVQMEPRIRVMKKRRGG